MTLLKDTEKDKLMNNSANNGYLNLMKYLHEFGCSWDEETCWCAALNGHLYCLKYLHENGCSWDEDTCYNAAYGGSSSKQPGERSSQDHLDCLKYLHENGCSWRSTTCSAASVGGNLDCSQDPYDKQTCINQAKKNNHEEIIDYLSSI